MLAELRGSEHARGDPRRGELRPIRRDWTRSSVTGTAPLKHVWRARIVAAVEQIRHSRLDNRARTARPNPNFQFSKNRSLQRDNWSWWS